MTKTEEKHIVTEEEKNQQIYNMVDNLVKKSHVALDQMANFSQRPENKMHIHWQRWQLKKLSVVS